MTFPCFLYSWNSPSFSDVSDDLIGRFLTQIASGRLSSECTTGWWAPPPEVANLLDLGDPVEEVALEVELLDELLLLRDLDLDGDLEDVLPADGDLLPDLDLVFFLAFCASVRLSSPCEYASPLLYLVASYDDQEATGRCGLPSATLLYVGPFLP